MVETLGLDLEANDGDEFMIRLMVGALENSRVQQAGSKFSNNQY